MASVHSDSTAMVCEGDLLAGKYRVERVLGSGGMGAVVAARHVQLDERVAIKFLRTELLTNAEAVRRFTNEARAAVRIKGEHVGRVSDVGTLESGAPYMVMEYLDGGDLQAWLQQRGPLPIDQAVEFVLQACVAVAEAHTLGIVHRDIKPGNLFCVRRADGRLLIKVLDFGISKVTQADDSSGMWATRTGAVMGTPLYMAPEQAQGRRDVGPAADIWSLGVVLFELLAGRPPFLAEGFGELVVAVVTGLAPGVREFRPDAPSGLDRAIAKCLEKAPADRFANVAELASALGPYGPPAARALVTQIHGIVAGAGMSIGVPLSPGGQGAPAGAWTLSGGTAGPAPGGPDRAPVRQFLRTMLHAVGLPIEPNAASPSRRPNRSSDRGGDSGVRERRSSPESEDASAPSFRGAFGDVVAWGDFYGCLPDSLRPHAHGIRGLIAARYSSAIAAGPHLVRLDGARRTGTFDGPVFAIFLSGSGGAAGVGKETFMAYAEPLESRLRQLDPERTKLVIAIADTYALGKGVRERIAYYQEHYRTKVVPLYLGEILRAEHDGRLDTLFDDRIFDLYARPNLFARRGGPADPTRIVGNEDLVREIMAGLQGTGRVLLVTGAPGSGKSSLLELVKYRMDDIDWSVVDSHIANRTADGLAAAIRLACGTELPQGMNGIASLSTTSVARHRAVRSTRWQQAAPAPAAQIVVLEDADWAIDALVAGDAQMQEVWASLARQVVARELQLVVTGFGVGRLGLRLVSTWENPLARLVAAYRAPVLTRRAANGVIDELALGCNVRFDDSAAVKAAALSGGNMDMLLRLCAHVVDMLANRDDEHPLALVHVRKRHVARSAEMMVNDCLCMQGTALDLVDGTERAILDRIALARPSPRALQRAFERADPALIASKLARLTRMGLVRNVGGRETISIPLVARWLKAQVGAAPGEAMIRRNRVVAVLWLGMSCALLLVAVRATRHSSSAPGSFLTTLSSNLAVYCAGFGAIAIALLGLNRNFKGLVNKILRDFGWGTPAPEDPDPPENPAAKRD